MTKFTWAMGRTNGVPTGFWRDSMEETYWTRRSVRRRDVLRGGFLATAGLAGAALIGCGGGDEESPAATSAGGSSGTQVADSTGTATPPAEDVHGGEYIFPNFANLEDIYDPHMSGYLAHHVFGNWAANLLVRTSPDASEINGELIESWEIPGDGSEYILHVRPGVKWHNKAPTNGRELSAEDVAFNIERITGMLDPDGPGRYQRRSTLPFLESATATDDHTVTVKLARPTPTLLSGLTDYRNTVVPKDFVEGGGNFADFASLVGTGPFITTSMSGDGTVTWERNPDYWEDAVPYFDSVRMVTMRDPLTALTALGQRQVYHYIAPPKAVREQAAQIAPETREEVWTFADRTNVQYNVTRPPFDDVRLRHALQRAIPFQQLNDNQLGEGYWNLGAVLPVAFPQAWPEDQVAQLPGYNPSTKEQDIAEANKLLDAAGFVQGQGLSFQLFGGGEYSTALQGEYKKIWANMDVATRIFAPGDAATAQSAQSQGDFDIALSINFSFPDPGVDFLAWYGTDQGRNYGKYSNPAVDDIIDRILTTVDPDERQARIDEAQDLIWEELPSFIYYSSKTNVLFDSAVGGMEGFGRRLGGSAHHDTMRYMRYGFFTDASLRG